MLDVDPDQVDALRFTRLVTAAVAAQPAAAQDRFSEALAPLQRLGNLDATAEVLITLGRARQAQGELPAADAAWQEAASLVGSDHWLSPTISKLLRQPYDTSTPTA